MSEDASPTTRLRALSPAPLRHEQRLPAGGLVIGRDPEQADCLISARRVSRRHCRIERTDEGWIIIDLDSTNGVYVDGERVNGQQLLKPGQVIGLGSADPPDFEFVAGERSRTRLSLPPAQRWRIGRALDCDVALPADPTISERHGEIVPGDEGLSIVDHGSLNGIRIGGRRIPAHRSCRLSEKTPVEIGNTCLAFEITDEAGLEVAIESRTPRLRVDARAITTPALGNKGLDCTIESGQLAGIRSEHPRAASALLQILTGRAQPASGQRFFEDGLAGRSESISAHRVGFVGREDTLDATLTVRQHLQYTAELRLPPDIDKHRRRCLIETTLSQLGLTKVANRRLDALGPGQRRLAAIAAEVVTRPAILGLDHPFSDLDNDQYRQVLAQLRFLARTGTIVLIADVSPGAERELDVLIDLDRPESFSKTSETAGPSESSPDPASKPGFSRKRLATLFRRQCRIRLNDPGMIVLYLLLPALLAMTAIAVSAHIDFRLALFLVTMATAVFTAAPEICADRARLRHEFLVGIAPGEELLARLAFCWMIAIVQVPLITAMIGVQAGIDLHESSRTVGVLILAAWASSALGLMIGTLDPTRARLVMPVAASVIALQWLVMTASAPDQVFLAWLFDRVRDLLPAYWGMNLLSALEGRPIDDIRRVVQSLAFLIGQMVTWTIIARGLLNRQLRER